MYKDAKYRFYMIIMRHSGRNIPKKKYAFH
jgi:hypothetical protein